VPERDILTAGDALVFGHRGIRALLLECSDMVPYTRMLADRPRLPMFSLCTFVTWFRSGRAPREFGHRAGAPREWRER
jgi:hypothetical protein